MNVDPNPAQLHAARQQLTLASRNAIRQIVDPTTTELSVRDWEDVVHFARLARDLERANVGGESPAVGPHTDWYTMPRRFLELAAEPKPEGMDAGIAIGKTSHLQLAERLVRGSRVSIAGE